MSRCAEGMGRGGESVQEFECMRGGAGFMRMQCGSGKYEAVDKRHSVD